MAGANNETTTKFKVDISELKSAMQEAKRQIQVTNSEFKAISSSMDNWAESTDGLKAKLNQLDSNLKSQKTILSSLEKQYELTVKQFGEGSTQADKLKISINNQKAVVNSTEKEIKDYTLQLKNCGKDTDDLKEKTKSAGDGFTVFKGALANLASDGIELAVAGVKKLAGAMVGLVKESISAYAEQEQLIGGVETLFGTGGMGLEEYAKSVGKAVDEVAGQYQSMQEAQKNVLRDANDAYKTAGLSANEYMETVTGFSASLIQSLDGDTLRASELANQAIVDMSDNANKMGSDIESLKTAYAGFAKGQYTLLDNLKLGYGGTKTEMERLLKDAESFSGIKYDISSYADVIEAIHVIQDNMGITGTTAKEASSTISGSIGALKSSWENLITGMANPDADLGQLIGNLVDSAKTVLTNIQPVLVQAIQGLAKLITDISPIIMQELPAIINQLLPVILEGARTLFTSTLTFISENLPMIIDTIITILVDGIPIILDGAIQLFDALVQAIPLIVTKLWEALPQILDAIVNFLMDLGTRIATLVLLLAYNVAVWAEDIKSKAVTATQDLVNKVVEWFKLLPDKIWTWLVNVVTKITTWGINLAQKGRQAGQDLMDAIINKVKEIPEKMLAVGRNIVEGLWNGISNAGQWLKDKISGWVGDVTGWVQKFFEIGSPSKLMAREVGKWIPAGIAVGIDKNTGVVLDSMRNLTMGTVSATRDGLGTAGGGIVNNYTQVINSPKQLSRLDIYRQSKNLLGYAGGAL